MRRWSRPGGGGGRTRVLADGALFEKAGVGFSDVHGTLRPEMAKALPGEGLDFRAAGLSLIFHPKSPRVPTVHANIRHIARGARCDSESSASRSYAPSRLNAGK